MFLSKELDKIFTVNEFKFDGLPNKVVHSLNKLLEIYSRDTLIEAMNSLIAPYEAEEETARKYRGCSGYAGELHTATELRIIYLKDSIEYVQNHSNDLSSDAS